MRRNTPKNDSKKRTILTVSCIVLAIVCVLLLPITCSPTPKQPSIVAPGYSSSQSSSRSRGSGVSRQPRRGDTSNNQSKSGSLVRPGEGITNYDPYHNEPSFQSQGDGQGKLAISISVLVVLLVSYVVAKVKSKDGELVITANTIDKILILTAPVLCFIAWCPGIDHELSSFQVTLFSLSGLMLQGSIIFSITANKGNILNISLSIMAKLFIFILTFFLLLLFVAVLVISFMLSAMSHSRYEETYVVKYDHFLDQWVGYRID